MVKEEASEKYPRFLEEDKDLLEATAEPPSWGALLHNPLNPGSEEPKSRVGAIVSPGDGDDVKIEDPCLIVGRPTDTRSYDSDAGLTLMGSEGG